MKRKGLVRKFAVSLAVVATMCSVMPALHAGASTNTIQTRYIVGDGVRLRKEGWLGGQILELMYNGEKINYYPERYGTDPEFNYMQRVKTGTYGYVNHDYTRF